MFAIFAIFVTILPICVAALVWKLCPMRACHKRNKRAETITNNSETIMCVT